MSWDDDFSSDDLFPGDDEEFEPHAEDDSWRAASRAGKASVALGVVACGTMLLFLRATLAGGSLGFLGAAGMTLALSAAVIGLVLGLYGLCQKRFRRGWPILGVLVSGGVLMVLLILALELRE